MLKVLLLLLLLLTTTVCAAEDLAPVTVVIPKTKHFTEQLQLSGTLTAARHANLSARTEGLVANVLVDAGDNVTAGQPLLELDTQLAKHQLNQLNAAYLAAQVDLAEKKRQLSEAEKLAADKLFPQTELASRRSAVAQAEAVAAQTKAAEQQQQELVQRHVLTAPFNGVIARRLTDVGEWVARGTAVLELVSLDHLRLDLQAPQEQYQALSGQHNVRVRADMLPGTDFPARITALVPVSDASARSFLVRVELDEQQHRLLPGTSATASFALENTARQVMVVPPDAILRHPDDSFSLFAVHGDKVKRHLVRLGRSSTDGVEILSGLTEPLPVVIRGNEILQEDQPVRVLTTNTP